MKQFKSLREYFLNVLTVAALISEVHVAEKGKKTKQLLKKYYCATSQINL